MLRNHVRIVLVLRVAAAWEDDRDRVTGRCELTEPRDDRAHGFNIINNERQRSGAIGIVDSSRRVGAVGN